MTSSRLESLAACAGLFEPWTGPFDREELDRWVAAELGQVDALENPVAHGPVRSLARAPRQILDVVSGNTPHAAAQSLLRGLTLGSRNLVKLPSGGLPPFEALVAELPPELGALVELHEALPADWQTACDALIVFGDDATIAWFAQRVSPDALFQPHGQRLSMALVEEDPETAARLAARDVARFDQRGCLSLHDVYVAGSLSESRHFAELLAGELQSFEVDHPRAPLTPSGSGAITTLRENTRFLAANQPDEVALWESPGGTAWTVIWESDPTLRVSCLDRVAFVKPWPEPGSLPDSLGPARRHLASLALHPFTSDRARELALKVPEADRLCPLGRTQNPTIFWHHDGVAPLASLVRWTDLG